MEMRSASFLTSDGVRLHVLEGGPAPRAGAPTIAFAPGWSMPASLWHEQMAILGKTYAVAALDPRGQGRSEIPDSGYDIARRATDLHEFVARYPRVVLVAWSLAALEALEAINVHGDARIEALVLVDSSVGEEPAPASGSPFIESLKENRQTTVRDFVRGMFRSLRSDRELSDLAQLALRMPLEASLALFPRSIPREHWREIAHGFSKPLLYVVTPQFAEQASNLERNRPGTRIAVFEEAGHALFADEPERFSRLVSAFVESVTDDPGHH
jgi:microsomal epoxide hydrolase